MTRLSAATLRTLPESIARPAYDRSAVAAGIVHLGIGAFHRAHQAVYTESVLAAGDRRWGIVGASLRSPDTRDALAAQDGLYALNIRGESDQLAVIGSVQAVLVAPEDPAALLNRMCQPGVAIVSLTVTEKAYCQQAATGSLDAAHADIRHDLANPAAPRSALGFLAAAIARRRAAGLPPFTVLCCDNLPSNGHTVHRLLTEYATLVSPDLAAYVRSEIACPDTMVDRIVPATTAEDRTRIAAALGLTDAWPVVTEPFTQWVIEDRFPAGRPAWETAGATLVADVAPFEAMKLRLLNGSHSALAYLGYLAGYQTVAETMQDTGIAGFVRRLMEDATPTLSLPAGWDVAGINGP
ncbi:MAG: mannitol dehydrogenase family protein [Acetobacteraceae bacterium]